MHAREHLIGIALLFLAVALSGSAIAYAITHWQLEVSLDADHCPATPPATVLAAFDITDRPPIQEQERIIANVVAIAERMRQHERMALHVIGGNPEQSAAPWPLPGFPRGFRLCKSADPTRVDRSVQNERLVRATYEQDFLNPLRAALPELVKGGKAARSPLLHAIEILMHSPLFRPEVPNRTLVIFSDLLIHTRALSHITQPLSQPCSVLASPIGVRLKARNWRGVRVILEYLRNPRDADRQTPEHLRFWSDLFYLLGAAQVFDGETLIANTTSTCTARVAIAHTGRSKKTRP